MPMFNSFGGQASIGRKAPRVAAEGRQRGVRDGLDLRLHGLPELQEAAGKLRDDHEEKL